MLVTNKAPDFTATTVMGNNEIVDTFNLYENFGENGTVLFFYPLDFTFVCPSEIIAFDKRLDEFTARGINVIGVSIDSQFSHFAWKNTAVNQGGIGQVRFPLVADLTKQISRRCAARLFPDRQGRYGTPRGHQRPAPGTQHRRNDPHGRHDALHQRAR